MNSILTLPILLQLAGVMVIIAEIILPSGGILSLVAAGLFAYSLYHVFTHMSASAGMAFLIADLILIPVLVYIGIKFMARSPVTLRSSLLRGDGASSPSGDRKRYLGHTGLAITDLRPSGLAMIDNERLDVVTRGEYIEKRTTIVVIAVRGNQIVVKEQTPP